MQHEYRRNIRSPFEPGEKSRHGKTYVPDIEIDRTSRHRLHYRSARRNAGRQERRSKPPDPISNRHRARPTIMLRGSAENARSQVAPNDVIGWRSAFRPELLKPPQPPSDPPPPKNAHPP